MKKDRKIVELLKKSLIENFPGLIDKVIFFGSRVYGKPYKESDYDVLIIINSEKNWEIEDQISRICYKIALNFNIFPDYKILSIKDINTIYWHEPFILEAMEKGVLI